MPLPDQQLEVYNHVYIHNYLSAFLRGTADYFGNVLFDRCKEIVVSTYAKHVRHWRTRLQEGGEKLTPRYPYLVVDPGLDFEPDPQSGRFFYQYPQFDKTTAGRMFNPVIYDDGNVYIAPCLNRYRGRINMILYCSTYNDLMDNHIMVQQFFGGQDRIIKPKNIEGFIILPDEIVSYVYENEYTNEKYSLDWANNKADVYLVRNINQNRMCFPFETQPWYKLTSITDGSDKYGGSGDSIGDNRLNIEVEVEIELPTHLAVISRRSPRVCPENSKLEMDLTVGYHMVPLQHGDGTYQEQFVAEQQFTITGFNTSEAQTWQDVETRSDYMTYDETFYYDVTAENQAAITADPAQNFTVTLLRNVEDCRALKIFGKFGELKRDFHWRVIDDDVVEFIGPKVFRMREGDVLAFVYFKLFGPGEEIN